MQCCRDAAKPMPLSDNQSTPPSILNTMISSEEVSPLFFFFPLSVLIQPGVIGASPPQLSLTLLRKAIFPEIPIFAQSLSSS